MKGRETFLSDQPELNYSFSQSFHKFFTKAPYSKIQENLSQIEMTIATNPSRLMSNSSHKFTNLAESVLQQYSTGKRDFQHLKLEKANFRRANLRNINFQGVDLKKANLREVNLSGADLSYACLDGADLQGANLSNTNLTETSLNQAILNNANLVKSCLEKATLESAFMSGALLNEANLRQASLKAAHLNGAYLNEAYLEQANLSEAYLIKTYLIKANLVEANLCKTYLNGAFLYGSRLQGAYYNHQTCFDKEVDPTRLGMKKIAISTVGELLKILNYLSDYSCNYLGRTSIARYLESSRPTLPWFEQFQITAKAEIKFSGNLNEPLSLVQLERGQQWIDIFIDHCSRIVKSFSQLIQKDHLMILN